MAKQTPMDSLTPQESEEILRVAKDIGESIIVAEKKLILPHIKKPSFFVFGAEEGSSYFRTESNVKTVRKLAAENAAEEMDLFFGTTFVGMMQLAEGALGKKEAISTYLNALLAYCEKESPEFTETNAAKEIESYLENT